MKKNHLLTSCILGYCFLLSFGCKAQNTIFLNKGILQIKNQTILSSYSNFINDTKGYLINDGELHYHDTFTNEGIFSFTKRLTSGKVSFFLKNNKNQVIKGGSSVEFNHILFKSQQPKDYFFDLKSNIEIWGELDFSQGIIKVDSTVNHETKHSKGMISFMANSSYTNASDLSFIEGQVEKIGAKEFIFPVGDKGVLRPVKIGASGVNTNIFQVKYTLDDKAFFAKNAAKAGGINQVNNREYWRVLKGRGKADKDIKLTLSWDERTAIEGLLKDPEMELHIVRWDEKQQLWVDEGGVVDRSTKEVTTISTVKNYGYFTLATVKKDWILDGNVFIYNLVTPNGDGKNDYFIIDNINRYPNNRVEIYNRWGVRVYETTNYDVLGDGSSNVFTGYAEGKVKMDKGKKLPSGTYYYVITYEYKDDNGSRMIKKAANLHLETN